MMDNSRLKYYATDDCVRNFAKNYCDNDATMDLESICKKESARTFFMIEDAPSKQNPITTFRIEKHQDKFFGIKYISPFKILLNQAQICLHTSINVLPLLLDKNVDRVLYENPPFKLVNDMFSAQYIGNKIMCLTLLMMALECFVNENISHDVDEGVDEKGVKKDKDYIERKYDLKAKMQMIKKYNDIANTRYNTLVSAIIPLQKLRNEFVHLKSDRPNSLNDPCVDCYDKILSTDLNLALNSIIEYAKLVNPNIVLN